MLEIKIENNEKSILFPSKWVYEKNINNNYSITALVQYLLSSYHIEDVLCMYTTVLYTYG